MNTEPAPTDLRCERVRLLLSLAADDAATPAQTAEIDAHLPGCAACRAARGVDAAVRARFGAPVTASSGFAERVAAAALAQRRESRAQNRFLASAAAAAVLVAAAGGFVFEGLSARRPQATPVVATARDAAGRALATGLALGRAPTARAEGR